MASGHINQLTGLDDWVRNLVTARGDIIRFVLPIFDHHGSLHRRLLLRRQHGFFCVTARRQLFTNQVILIVVALYLLLLILV